ncbi:MAG TPA: VWA domain-containing protein [Pyrinomonadaceae bacterium]
MTWAKNSQRKSSLYACLLLCLFSPSLVRAQEPTLPSDPPPVMPGPTPKQTPPPPVEQEIEEGDVISVSTSEVMLPVTVRDASGRLVAELTRDDFRVFEDGREQPLSDLALRRVPVDVVLMVDASSSAAANLEDFRRAVEGFVSKLSPEDRVSLIKFDDRVELLQDWTRSRVQLRRSLGRVAPGVFTRFNDALLLAAKEQLAQAGGRHAVIVLTDGIDSGRGYTTLEAALRSLLEAQATVYVVSNTEIERRRKQAELDSLLAQTPAVVRFSELRIGDLREGLKVLDVSERNLEQLTAATGGRLYKPLSFDQLDATYAEVAEELRQQYALFYTPLNKTRDGRFRRVRVQTTTPTHQVSARIGYFAPGR